MQLSRPWTTRQAAERTVDRARSINSDGDGVGSIAAGGSSQSCGHACDMAQGACHKQAITPRTDVYMLRGIELAAAR
jgi:hypothetical protein